jgi:hypothetical protein
VVVVGGGGGGGGVVRGVVGGGVGFVVPGVTRGGCVTLGVTAGGGVVPKFGKPKKAGTVDVVELVELDVDVDDVELDDEAPTARCSRVVVPSTSAGTCSPRTAIVVGAAASAFDNASGVRASGIATTTAAVATPTAVSTTRPARECQRCAHQLMISSTVRR